MNGIILYYTLCKLIIATASLVIRHVTFDHVISYIIQSDIAVTGEPIPQKLYHLIDSPSRHICQYLIFDCSKPRTPSGGPAESAENDTRAKDVNFLDSGTVSGTAHNRCGVEENCMSIALVIYIYFFLAKCKQVDRLPAPRRDLARPMCQQRRFSFSTILLIFVQF